MRERINQRIAGAFKIRAQHDIDQPTRKFELKFEGHLASRIPQLRERPNSGQTIERSVDELHCYGLPVSRCVSGSKTFAETAAMQFEGCFNNIVLPIVHLGATAPWQKFRVRLDIVDQRKHLVCRVRNQRATIDATQNYAGLIEEIR